MRKIRNLVISLAVVGILVVVAIVGFAMSITPVLGLDLRGGVEVVLKAPPGTSKAVMDQALESIRRRVDALGVAEPNLSVVGTNIEVQVPGAGGGSIKTEPKVQYCLIGQAALSYGCYASQSSASTTASAVKVVPQVTQACLLNASGKQVGCFTTAADATAAQKAMTIQEQNPLGTPVPSPSPQPQGPGAKGSGSTQKPPAGTQWCLVGSTGQNYGCYKSSSAATAAQKAITVKTTSQYCLSGVSTASSSGCYSTQTEANAAKTAITVSRFTQQYCVFASDGRNVGCFPSQTQANDKLQSMSIGHLLDIIGKTARLEQRAVLYDSSNNPQFISKSSSQWNSWPVTCPNVTTEPTAPCAPNVLDKKAVIFLSQNGQSKYKLGPVLITGQAISRATAVYNTGQSTGSTAGWQVDFTLTSSGAKTFGQITSGMAPPPGSPPGTPGKQLAIVLDNQVISAPEVQSAITGGNGVISGNFTQQKAQDLATVLNAGALPVDLKPQQVQTVSATLGKASLQEGLIAGLAGLIMLALYLAFYYRVLGIVTWAGMAIWGILALGLVSWLGHTAGYALTLAGVAGIVVSLGITADSYIVFYERLKDEIRGGKTPRAAIQPAFKRAWRTIVAADTVTILAAVVLYVVAISSVRGFALTLGLCTGLDMFVVYFFKRPTVFLMARSERLMNMPRFGLTSGVAADVVPVPVAGGSR